MGDHPMLRTDSQTHHVPGADHRLPGLGLGPALHLPQRLGEHRQLGGGRDVADEDPARLGSRGQRLGVDEEEPRVEAPGTARRRDGAERPRDIASGIDLARSLKDKPATLGRVSGGVLMLRFAM